MKESISDILLKKHQKDLYETSSSIDLKSISKLKGYSSYLFDELGNIEVNGYPVGSDFISKDGDTFDMDDYEAFDDKKRKELKLRYHFLPYMHELYIGTTGSGKTTGCVEPQILALAAQKNKPNLFITDPKGEIYNHNVEYLKNQGYNTFILNFKDIYRSDKWNPLEEIYDSYLEKNKYEGYPIECDGMPDDSLAKFGKEYDNKYYKVLDLAFSTEEDALSYIKTQIDLITASTESLIRQFVYIFCPARVNSSDPSWSFGAQSTAEGIIRSMLVDVDNEKESGMTRDKFTLKTFFDYYNYIKADIYSQGRDVSPNYYVNNKLLKGKKEVIDKLRITLGTASVTMRGFLSTLDANVNDWYQGHILALTTGSSINIDEIISDKPFAIFVVTRDYEKSDYKVAGLFIDYIYRQLIKNFEELSIKGKKYTRQTHFLLDEFGNIPKIENFEIKIATSRSRGIWMHLFLQSYEQLQNVYGLEESEIIISNCNSQNFLGSQSYETIEKYSKTCGMKSERVFDNSLNLQNEYMNTNVLKMSDLDLIETGHMYIKRLYSPVIYSNFIRSYFLKEKSILDVLKYDGLYKLSPYNYESYKSEKYVLDIENMYKKSIKTDRDDKTKTSFSFDEDEFYNPFSEDEESDLNEEDDDIDFDFISNEARKADLIRRLKEMRNKRNSSDDEEE